MTRLATYRTLTAALAIVAAAALSAGAADSFNMNVNLDGLNLGSHVSGPSRSLDDLKGHVVIVEAWGVRCPPCRASLPKLATWQTEYADQGLIIIGTERQNSSDADIRTLCTEKGVNFTITKGGSVANGEDYRGIPHLFLFDHTGKCVYRGSPFSVETVLKETLQRAPSPMIGAESFDKLASLARQLKPGRPVTAVLTRAESMLESDDPDTAAEAKKLVEAINTYGQDRIEAAKANKLENPVWAYQCLAEVQKTYRGTEIGTTASELAREWKTDKAFMAEVEASELLQRVFAEQSRLRDVRGVSTDSPAYQRANRTPLSRILAIVKRMKARYPDAKATDQAMDIAKTYGLPVG